MPEKPTISETAIADIKAWLLLMVQASLDRMYKEHFVSGCTQITDPEAIAAQEAGAMCSGNYIKDTNTHWSKIDPSKL